jgi:hypothetical protein
MLQNCLLHSQPKRFCSPFSAEGTVAPSPAEATVSSFTAEVTVELRLQKTIQQFTARWQLSPFCSIRLFVKKDFSF